MNKSVSLAFLVAGVMMAIFGVSEMNSFTSDISCMLTGAPTDRSIWMMVGGVLVGLTGLVPSSRKLLCVFRRGGQSMQRIIAA